MADWMQTGNVFLSSILLMVTVIVGEIIALPHLDLSTLQLMIGIDIIFFIIAALGLLLIWNNRRPRLDVNVGNRVGQKTYADREHEDLVTSESTVQSLNVTAKKISISKLRAMVRVDNEGPYYFSWNTPISSTNRDNPLDVDLVEEQEIQLPIWSAMRNKEVFVTLNGLTAHRLTDYASKAELEIKIQFIGANYTEKKPRTFKLNVKSWNGLGLTSD